MSDDSGNLSIDFLVGFTIFMIAFVWVISLIPGLLIGLQAFTIDYDAVAYRTGVILAEDPGEPASWELAPYNQEWDKEDVERFGLAISRNDPNILARDKLNRFFDTVAFDYPDDYHRRAIFGDYPYKFNISFGNISGGEPGRSAGDVVPEGFGYIRRFVKVKGVSNATLSGLDGTTLTTAKYVNGDNATTQHIFTILLNNSELSGKESLIRDPAYQIIPAKESFTINLTNLKTTLNYKPNGPSTPMTSGTPWPDSVWYREECFDIRLKYGDVLVSDGFNQRNIRDLIIDDVPVSLTNAPNPVENSISIIYATDTDRKGINWEAAQVYISLKFTLVPSGYAGCPCRSAAANPKCTGSWFLNNTINYQPVYPFSYNYTNKMVTPPQLSDGVVEVAVW